MLIDTHSHLDFPEFDNDRDEVIRRSKEGGIGYIINVGSTLEGSRASLGLAERYEFIYAAVGVHPHDADSFDEKALLALNKLAKNKKVVAIGEVGLDYYRNLSGPDRQREVFISLTQLSIDCGLPLVIHTRLAEEDTLRILKGRRPQKALVHCFSGNADFLKECLDLNFFISFTCNVTYKKAHELREVVKAVPLERIMLETDAPYLSPEGMRGRRNEPLNVKILAQAIAQIRGISPEELENAVNKNAKEFFNLP